MRRQVGGSPVWLWVLALLSAIAMGLYAVPGADGAPRAYSSTDVASRTVSAKVFSEYRWHRPCRRSTGPGPCFYNADHRGNNAGTQYHLDRRERAYVPTRDINGHDGCYIRIADPSRVRCDDGYRLTIR